MEKLRNALQANERLFTIIGLALVACILMGYFVFYQFVITPQMRQRQALIGQLAITRGDLLREQRSGANAVSRLQQQVQEAQVQFENLLASFLSESRAAGTLDSLYRYAEQSEVEMTKLENEPALDQKSEHYDVRVFHIEVEGTFVSLADFISRIQEARQKSVRLGNLSIPAAEGAAQVLTMDMTLYTSPYADDLGAPGGDTAAQNLALLGRSLEQAWSAAKWGQAIDLISQILAFEPGDRDMLDRLYIARVNLGYDLLARGQAKEATTQFNLALIVKPDGPEAAAGLKRVATPEPGSSTPVVSSTAVPGATVAAPATLNPYLVRPNSWPTEWPWPPEGP